MNSRFLSFAVAVAAALAAAPPPVGAAEARRVVLDSPDVIVDVRAAVRHTTVIALPPGEQIVEFVAGDTEFWALAGAANIAYIKPTAEGARTNVALVTRGGRIYSFLCQEGGGDPDLVIHVQLAEDAGGGGRIGSPVHQPGFVSASEVAVYEEAAREAAERASRAEIEAAAAVAGEVDAFRAGYPSTLEFPYRLDEKARKDPFSVVAMWHDGRHTYLRSTAPESPAIYERRDGQPSLVEYELTADGLYIAQRVLRDGWLQVGRQRADWSWIPPARLAGGLP